MALKDLINVLKGRLSIQSRILTDHESPDFKTSSKRWSDISSQVPGAIISLASEADVVLTVRAALKASVPFVPATGGHSPWSTIGKDGFIIDLSGYKYVAVDPTRETVTVRGGLLMKELQVALAKENQFTTVANGNTVGVIPFFINGAISVYSPLIGYGCESILSAKLVTANGDVVEVTETSNAELLWAVRGAGQFFGVVLELCIKTYPFKLMGDPRGSRQLGTYIFLPQQASDVCHALAKVIADENLVSSGHLMVLAAPPGFKNQVVLVSPQCFASEEQVAKAFQPLAELKPLHHMQETSNFVTHSDNLDWVCAKGDFKRFNQIGLESFNAENFVKLVDLHAKLLEECPGAERSAFTFEWHSSPRRPLPRDPIDTAFGNQDVDLWLNTLTWCTDPDQHEELARFDQAAQAQMRVGTTQKAFVSYTNTSREDPIEYRYRGTERLEKLKVLKKEWDPKGVFTETFL